METLIGVFSALGSFSLELWLILLLGVITGLIVGVLPGLTFVMGVLLILPFTYGMEADTGIVLMLAVYVAGTYGGAITSILLHVPGEPNNVPLLWDGYTMTRQGRGAEALGWAAIAALVGGVVAWLLLVFAARPFAQIALKFDQAEYFVIILLGLTSVLALADRSIIKSLAALLIGMLIATIGVDDVYGTVRFDYGTTVLRDGVDYLPVMVGIYALGHVLVRYGERFSQENAPKVGRVRTTIPGLRALRERSGSMGRGTVTGTILGAVPGAGATVASFVAYGIEKQFGKDKGNVGKGSPNGVIAPQVASTSTVGGAFIPLLVLGIPGSAATAVILGALLIHNVQPGPQIFQTQPELVYTIMAALLVSVLMMFVIGLAASGPMVRLLRVPEPYVAVLIVLFAYIGAFAIRNSISDVWVMVLAAAVGFGMQRFGYPLAPLVLGAILGPLAERFFVTAMISADNDISIFVTRPISAGLVVLWVLVLGFLVYRAVVGRRVGVLATDVAPAGSEPGHDAGPDGPEGTEAVAPGPDPSDPANPSSRS
ncbi:tripartite tricarboxylate transporter permease [Aeromicrobium sp. CF4.19]|uniref:tripartite tricarboxylate transporter permease n=1 Tax=Aeromicrobium sp. CF4.19 TaxID=3373082 RepID=UPI003EE69CC1